VGLPGWEAEELAVCQRWGFSWDFADISSFSHIQDKFRLCLTPERHESQTPGGVCRGITGAAA